MDENEKTAGQLACETFWDVIDGAAGRVSRDRWIRLPAEYRRAWEAAAAVNVTQIT